eukprot:TRINITY_DN297_c1_g1_i3.p1 TRINITY_DN297_c1_g1~~TRINITY_DN297_c1_g1_i3.p1  ORF type:complete len:355 (-),score=84.98 TRINITY_DN297_c1_g1_i3:168-1187(-)
MAKLLIVFAAAIAVSVARELGAPLLGEDEPILNEKTINYINSLKTSWTASAEQGGMKGMTVRQARRLMGVQPRTPGMPTLPRLTYAGQSIQVPDNFDSRTRWPHCSSIKQIRDQSACGSDWAFAPVEAMSDRYCISGIDTDLSISAQDMNSCCTSCWTGGGYGCDGGFPSQAWLYWKTTGVVSEKCSPYSLPSCDHYNTSSSNPCPKKNYPTPSCVQKCHDDEDWNLSLHFANQVWTAAGEQDIMTEIYKNGPVSTSFTVYSDFPAYKSGVYVQHSNHSLGTHAVKFIGWGVDNTTSLKYWLVANSWNVNWGDQGFFKILRGVDECGIEEETDFGTPNV